METATISSVTVDLRGVVQDANLYTYIIAQMAARGVLVAGGGFQWYVKRADGILSDPFNSPHKAIDYALDILTGEEANDG